MNFDFLADIFFPPACAHCDAAVSKGTLCDKCRATIVPSRSFVRVACDNPRFSYLLGSAASYGCPALKSLVHALKFRGIRSAALPLAELLIECAVRMPLDLRDFIVIPVPLSKRRRRGRGFNQSEKIAVPFAAHFRLPVAAGLLVRARHTSPQSDAASVAERMKNIRDCFAVRDPSSLAGRKVLLVDDVITSGATFFEAARTLHAAGARSIVALAVARA